MFDYDFGKKTSNNMEIYGQATPPAYPIENLRNFPILLVGGKTDRLC